MKIKKLLVLSLCSLMLLANVTKPGVSCYGGSIDCELTDEKLVDR